MKLCIQCKWLNANGDCTHANNEKVNPVDGKPRFVWAALTHRTAANQADMCGPDAKWFEPKEVNEQSN